MLIIRVVIHFDVVIVHHNHQLSALFGANVDLLLVFLVEPVLRACVPYPSVYEITPAEWWNTFASTFRLCKMLLHSINNPLVIILILITVTRLHWNIGAPSAMPCRALH